MSSAGGAGSRLTNSNNSVNSSTAGISGADETRQIPTPEERIAEFWETYPAFIENFNDKRKGDIPLKASVKDQVRDLFEEHVQTKRDFKEAMEALEWAKNRDLINMNIEKFIGSEYWKQLHEKMEEPPDTGVTVI